MERPAPGAVVAREIAVECAGSERQYEEFDAAPLAFPPEAGLERGAAVHLVGP